MNRSLSKIKSIVLLFPLLASFIPQSLSGSTPRPEYPRPQFERSDWRNLNGEWTYDFDFGKSGMDRKLYDSKGFKNTIIVPFCPESELSGVKYTDFIPAIWYQRNIQMPAEWQGKRIKLHFGGVDYFSALYIDGSLVGRHWGGSSPISYDITDFVKDGEEHSLVLRVEDDTRSGEQTNGKQSANYYSQGCDYTRTTGIWQTVWMEPVAENGLESAYIIPDLDYGQFIIQPKFRKTENGQTLDIAIKDGSRIVAQSKNKVRPGMSVSMPIKNVKTWSPESPFLYDVELTVKDAAGNEIDKVKSYAGMRKIHVDGDRIYLNNEPYYLRLVLDQGFYPTGIWTAPTDADLKRDIELGMEAGFNGARLHQKVFEERYHYWADKLGYLTWGETASWGANTNKIETARNFIPEWESVVIRDRNHPSIIAWTPFNETWERPLESEPAMQHDRLISDIYQLTRNLDYRPINDASGHYHVVTDLWTVHSYEQDPAKLTEYFRVKDGLYPSQDHRREVRYSGQPFLIDEYGGIKWIDGENFADNSWGYGDAPKTKEEVYERMKGITDVILGVPYVSGYCYTQLMDVEQEQNGIYNYDRSTKFDMKRIKEIFGKNPKSYNK